MIHYCHKGSNSVLAPVGLLIDYLKKDTDDFDKISCIDPS